METRANYLLVGLFVISLFVGGIGFVVWLAKVNVDASITSYEIHFEDSVSGLREGASVSYRGINVGEVKTIRIDPENLERIVVTIEVRADTPIRSDTVATLAIQGLAGGSYVLLSGGSQSAAPLVPQPGQRMAVIASKASGLQELLDSAPSVLSEANLVLKRANDLLRPENKILEENRGQLAEFTSSGLFEVVAFFSEARDLVTNVNRLLGQIERDPGNFIFGNRSEGYDAGTPD